MLFEPSKLQAADLAVIGKIDRLRSELRYATSDEKRWTGLLRRDAFARAIRGSNTIEGYHVTIDDAVAAAEDEEPLDADRETWAAVTGYCDALTYILQLESDPHFVHSEALIRSLHYMLLKYDLSKRPGQWRPGPVRVVDERKGQVIYVGPDASLVPNLMSELVESLNAVDDTPVMVRAAMAHLNLTMIHPFSDGNGRMARALQTLVLVREGILSRTFCSIEEYLGRNQNEYYEVLSEVGQGAWRPGNDVQPWLRFCLTAHYRCATSLLRRTRELRTLWNEVEGLIEKHKLPQRIETALVMAAFGRRIRNSIYRKDAEISEQVASRDLKKASDVGLLLPEGETRARVYLGSQILLDLRAAVREERNDDDPYTVADSR